MDPTATAVLASWSLDLGTLSLLLAIAALYMQRFVTVGTPDTLRWLMVVLAAAIVALRLVGRRTK